ncbi:unnamed protein product [Lasius platythorax]|uniref:Uncharacterized protein n=1 Tax=Lasius platythorax TaxID=488582 RepID=A0AAV2NB78_9HYME
MEQELLQMNIQMKKNKNRFTRKPQDLVELDKLSSEYIGFSEMLPAETDDETQIGTKELKIRKYSQLPMTPRHTRSTSKTASNLPPTPGPVPPKKLSESGEPWALNETYESYVASVKFRSDSAWTALQKCASLALRASEEIRDF